MLGAGSRLVHIGDTAPQKVTDVRGQRVDLALVSIEAEGKEAAILEPEILVEAPLERGGVGLESCCPFRIVPELARQAGRPQLCIVGITLQLAGRTRRWRRRPVAEHD